MSRLMQIAMVPADRAPWHLLALADPSVERVLGYVRKGVVFVGYEVDVPVVVAVVVRDAEVLELMNIAVAEGLRADGRGRRMLDHVLAFARSSGARRVLVGTGNSSVGPLRFYQRNGFRITGIEKDFFKAYDPPIFEAGVRCLDMIRLSLEIEKA